MIEIKNGRIYFYNAANPNLKVLDFRCLSAYVCPACKNVLGAYFAGYVIEESLREYIEKDSLKYAYETGTIQGAQWIVMREHQHKEVCRWEVVGAQSRGIENAVDSFLKAHNTTVKDRRVLINAIEAGTMPGFKKVPDEMGADLPIVIYNQSELIDDEGLSFDEKWKLIENIGSCIDSKLQAINATTHEKEES
ncbi:MAG: hypothetical protein Q8P40_09550 [Nitrospirota bacterium]|nr:hypothetical protein [Nitrospirota bacterium]